MQCTARSKRSGQQCQKGATPGRIVCHMHGGKTPAGAASPQFKTGRYSKQLPVRLAARYQEAQADAELISLHDDVALLDTRLSELLEHLDTDPGAIWADVLGLIEQRRKLVESESRRLQVLQQMIPAENALLLIGLLERAVKRHVTDPRQLAAISAELLELTVIES